MSDPAGIAIITAIATGTVQKISDSVSDSTAEAFKSLCKKVFARFRGLPEAQEALDGVRLDSEDGSALEAVADHLHRAEQEDPEIARLMAELRRAVEDRGAGSVVNTVHGGVSDEAKVVQGRDFHGDLRL
ncbi:hypothetical protein GCM10007147_09630 [Nocardiopsis kunsanensis]|uniref:Uncharacterized protein n=1 Tax=Nocardiopsis kunsanensis TaxID=141693 RepID=A0A919CFP2_9ACTN|nr:hypothetical protein [Nocardiopsis kunsanensis]GHD18937.1 hypothetical protein GCM10007147_09630 [Nocardiopsis kunsanensis]